MNSVEQFLAFCVRQERPLHWPTHDRQKEQRPQHFHYVIVGMLVIVEENDVKERREAFAFESASFRSGRGDCQHSNGRMNRKGGATDSTGLHPSWEVVPGSELP